MAAHAVRGLHQLFDAIWWKPEQAFEELRHQHYMSGRVE